MARLDPKSAELIRQFVPVRLNNIRGVNLDVFEFDYDLSWVAFFLNPDERVLGRFGSRTPEDPDKYRTMESLQFAMQAALKRHRMGTPLEKPAQRPPRNIDQYPGIARFAPTSCAHCHHVYDLRREMLEEKGTWSLSEVWVYPLPENVGWTMAVNPGNRVDAVTPQSAADQVGMKAGDVLLEVNNLPVATFTDIQFALHKAPASGELPVKWDREGKVMEATLKLSEGWRKTDVSWRQSLKGLKPSSELHGDDLTVDEKKQLGLTADALAFREGNFVKAQARQAGVQQNDIILGVDGMKLRMTARQFDAYVRLNYRQGDTVTLNVLREGKRLELRMKLAG